MSSMFVPLFFVGFVTGIIALGVGYILSIGNIAIASVIAIVWEIVYWKLLFPPTKSETQH